MNKKYFLTIADAIEFTNTLSLNSTAAVVNNNDKIFVTWIENKDYITCTGETCTDEVWIKGDGSMILCQDLEPEHAKNIIRMMIRNARNENNLSSDLMQDDINEDEPRVLH